MTKNSAIICLMGPTSTGKSKLALDIVKKLPCEIISVDSALVYRGMNIGTAKPDQETLKRVPHHLIDICDPTERYSAGKFLEDVYKVIEDIQSRNKIPLLTGGTMLYFRVLIQGIAQIPPADAKLRKQIDAQAKLKGWQALHHCLQQIDPKAAIRIHPNDSQRIQRALEIYQQTGITMTQHFIDQQKQKLMSKVINIALVPDDRKILHDHIEQRFQYMLKKGLIEEVRHLLKMRGMSLALPSMRAVGYRQIGLYLAGEYNKQEMIMKAVVATRQLAKRQLTWLRSWEHLKTLAPYSENLLPQIVDYLARHSLLADLRLSSRL